MIFFHSKWGLKNTFHLRFECRYSSIENAPEHNCVPESRKRYELDLNSQIYLKWVGDINLVDMILLIRSWVNDYLVDTIHFARAMFTGKTEKWYNISTWDWCALYIIILIIYEPFRIGHVLMRLSMNNYIYRISYSEIQTARILCEWINASSSTHHIIQAAEVLISIENIKWQNPRKEE